MKRPWPGAGQRGVVLVVSLLVLLVLAVIATTVARTNLLELRMAGNDEARIAALQQALAAVDAVLADPANTPLDAGVGHRLCMPGCADPTCNEHTLALAPDFVPEAPSPDIAVTRVAPLERRVPLMAEERASSAVYYRMATFEVQVRYGELSRGSSRASLTQGLLVRQPSAPGVGGGIP